MGTAKKILELTNYRFSFMVKGTDSQFHRPAQVAYKIVDVGTGTIIQDWASIVMTADEMPIDIPADLNVCLSDSSASEERQVIIKAVGFAQGVETYTIERCR